MLFTRIIKGITLLSLSGIVKGDPVNVTVTSPSGVSYVGLRYTDTNQDIFQGIPYAKPPVGSLRFQPPQAWSPTGNSTVVDATFNRSICVQSTPIDYSTDSEDCLHISLCELLVAGSFRLLVLNRICRETEQCDFETASHGLDL